MGYSGRYHVASLVAVFIALAVGIVIGVGLADDVVSSASQELEDSLRSDLDEAEGRRDELSAMLDRERDFGERAYPALVSNRLAGSSVAIVGIGGLGDDVVDDIESAVEPAGASVDAAAVVAMPPDLEALADAAPSRFNAARRGGAELERLGRAAGAGIVGGSGLLDQVRGTLLSRFSGTLDEVDRVIFVGAPSDDLDPEEADAARSLLDGMVEGAGRKAAGVAAVERSETDPTTLGPYSEAGIPTVDHADLVAGRVAVVFALLGAGGDYGVKEGADRFLPELISPAQRAGTTAAGR
jgi:hypothetical protein